MKGPCLAGNGMFATESVRFVGVTSPLRANASLPADAAVAKHHCDVSK